MHVYEGSGYSDDQLPPGMMMGPCPLPRTEDQPIRHLILDSEFGAGMEEHAGQCRVPTQVLPLQFPQPCPRAPQAPTNCVNPLESLLKLARVYFCNIVLCVESWCPTLARDLNPWASF